MGAKVEGFTVGKYPDVVAKKDVDLYVCDDCNPQWDTFDPALAKAHSDAGLHQERGKPYPFAVPGQEKAK